MSICSRNGELSKKRELITKLLNKAIIAFSALQSFWWAHFKAFTPKTLIELVLMPQVIAHKTFLEIPAE